MAALRRGWYPGEDGFSDRLLNMLNPAKAKSRSKSSLAEAAIRDFGLAQAEHLIGCLATEMGLPPTSEELAFLPKEDPRKVSFAALFEIRNVAPKKSLSLWLAMDHPASLNKRIEQLHPHHASRSAQASKLSENMVNYLNPRTDPIHAGDWGTAYASVGIGLPPISVPLPPLDIKSFPDEDSETNLHNEKIYHAAAGDEVSSFATARIGEKGRRVSYRQFGKDAPWIFSEIIFHVESDWKVNLRGRTSTTVQWDLLIKPDQSQSVIVSRSPHAPASTPGISIFNNLNLYARSELDQFILIKDGLLNMEGHLQSFVESGSGAWPEPPIPPTVK